MVKADFNVPSSYKTLEVVKQFGDEGSGESVNVHKCISHENKVFFHVVHMPAMKDISSYTDIRTISSYYVKDDENEHFVGHEAIDAAERYYREEVA